MVGKLTPDNMVSASRVPQLLGLSPYATQNELLADMIAHDEGTYQDSFQGNELTYWGNVHEPAIIRRTAELLNLEEVEEEITLPFFHDTIKMACSLDGQAKGTGVVRSQGNIFVVGADEYDLTGQTVLIECKTTQSIPEDNLAVWRGPVQLQAQMMCTGAEYGAVAVLYRGSELRIWIYKADPTVQRGIELAIEDLEERRKVGDWYPAASSEDANVAWSKVDDGAPPLEAKDDDVKDAVSRLVAAKQAIKDNQAIISDCEATIKEYMGNHEQLNAATDAGMVLVKWPMRKTKAQPEKVVPAKPATETRQNTLSIKMLEVQ